MWGKMKRIFNRAAVTQPLFWSFELGEDDCALSLSFFFPLNIAHDKVFPRSESK
jgi:hypothetical protein